MQIVRVDYQPGAFFEGYNEADLFGFALKGAYQKRHKTIVHLEDSTALDLCNAKRHSAGSKCLAIFCNYLHAMKLSAIHHRYGSVPVSGLIIKEPSSLFHTPYGEIGTFKGISLFYSKSPLADKFPPILLNSKTEYPITVKIYGADPTGWSVKDISIYHDTVFANCGQILEQQLRVAMESHVNMESFKRFIVMLSKDIMEQRDGEKQETDYQWGYTET